MSNSLKSRWKVFALAGVFLVSLAFPFMFPNPATLSIALVTLMYVGLASSWNILGGYAGYVSLGISAFYGVGGYAFVIILHQLRVAPGYLPFAFVPVIGLLTAAAAVPLGWAALRTRHAVFITVTIAIMFVVQLLAFNLTSLTGGTAGLGFPVPNWSANFYFRPFYYAMLAVVVLAIFISFIVRRSGVGLGLLAIRDDEDKAEAIGVPTTYYKLTAFVLSAGLAGMIGAIYSYSVLYIYPQNAVDPLVSMGGALMSFLGGAGTLFGPVLGALILAPAQIELSYYVNGQLYLILYGGLFLVIIRLMPRGIIPSVEDVIRYWRSRHLGGMVADGEGAHPGHEATAHSPDSDIEQVLEELSE
jgi:branched-chain amino acid transport system permease protein